MEGYPDEKKLDGYDAVVLGCSNNHRVVLLFDTCGSRCSQCSSKGGNEGLYLKPFSDYPCKHCHDWPWDHGEGGQCVFAPTKWEPSNPAELTQLHTDGTFVGNWTVKP